MVCPLGLHRSFAELDIMLVGAHIFDKSQSGAERADEVTVLAVGRLYLTAGDFGPPVRQSMCMNGNVAEWVVDWNTEE